jgi:glycerol-3-phosphate dehydrogenase
VDRYGSEARTVIAMMQADPDLAGPLVDGLPYVRAEAVYAVRYEMGWTLDDVLSRRTRCLLLARDASAAAAGSVARLIAPELGWSASRAEAEAETFRAAVRRAVASERGTTPDAEAATTEAARGQEAGAGGSGRTGPGSGPTEAGGSGRTGPGSAPTEAGGSGRTGPGSAPTQAGAKERR